MLGWEFVPAVVAVGVVIFVWGRSVGEAAARRSTPRGCTVWHRSDKNELIVTSLDVPNHSTVYKLAPGKKGAA